MRYAQLALVAFTSYGHFATAAPVNNGWFSGWFTSWSQSAGSSTPSDYNELSFFAALTTQDGLTISDGSPDVAFKPALQGATDTTPLLSIGGWAGSQYFSSLVKTADSRTKFATAVAKLVADNGFAGVDIDWEFPNGKPKDQNEITWDKGNFCNEYDAQDTANFLEFIRVLRPAVKTAINKDPILTASVPINGLFDADGNKLTDASAWVSTDTLDYITVMTYDVAHTYRKETGINSPLDDSNAPDDQKMSIKTSIDYWTNTAKVPAENIQLGLATYGKIFQTTLTQGEDLKEGSGGSKAYQPKTMPKLSADDSENQGNVQAGPDDKQENDKCGIWRDYGSAYGYADLIAANKFVGADGKTPVGNFQYFWDDTTASPFLYDKTSGLFVTYDNPDSIKAKTAWAKKAGLKGIKLFSVQGDTGDLIKAAKEGWAS